MYTSKKKGTRPAAFTLVVLGLMLAACETPTDPMSGGQTATQMPVMMRDGTEATDAIVVDEDGAITAYIEESIGVAANTNRPHTIITGRTTYATQTVSALLLNVRVDGDGNVAGMGTATIRGQESDFTATCVKEISSFGEQFYGISVRLESPIQFHNRYYEYAAISVTDRGQLGGLVMAHTDACRGSSLRYPYQPLSGMIRAIVG